MTSVSKIPENINKYAIQWARNICTEPIENGKGIDFFSKKIIKESELYKGTIDSLYNYDFRYEPKDIFIHNHPHGTPLSINDISAAAYCRIKKIFASTQNGYTAVDLTTIDKSITSKDIEIWATNSIGKCTNFIKELDCLVDLAKNSEDKISIASTNNMKICNYLRNKLQEFAKFTGAIFEDIKWQDTEKFGN